MSQPEILRWDQAYNRNRDAKLPRAVVNAIRTYMDNDELTGWVSQATLARDTGLDESNVRRQIRKNVDAGWLIVTKRGRTGRASRYQLTYAQPGADARLVPPLTAQIRTVSGPASNRAQTPGYAPQPGADARSIPGADARPTSPGTSPQGKFLGVISGPGAIAGAAGGAAPAFGFGPQPRSDDPFASEGEREYAREDRVTSERSGCNVNPFCTEPQPCRCGN